MTGFAAAAAFASGDPAWHWTGIGLMVVSLFLDRADGELARQTGQMSRFGHLYDLVADGSANAAIFVGIGLGLPAAALNGWGLELGIIAGIAVVAAELLVMRLDATGQQKTSDMGGFWGFDADDAMFLVPVALAFGWNAPLILAAAIGASLAALVMLILLVRRPVGGGDG